MTKRIFRSMLLAVGAALLACLVIIMGCLYEYFAGVQEKQLKDELAFAAAATEDYGSKYLERLDSINCRVTWLAADGSVLFDSHSDAAEMENHADREEISEALQYGEGESVRYSSTLMRRTVYSAKRLIDGSILRVSTDRLGALPLALGMLQPILLVLIAALIISGLLAKNVASRIVMPLNALDLDRPLENDTYDELSPLLTRLDCQQTEITAQLGRLRRQRDEFSHITNNMREGLVLLDGQCRILSINPTAQSVFSAENNCVGKDFISIERSCEVSRAVQSALSEGHGSLRAERGGRIYQLDVSRIESEGAVIGAVLLAFDVTERELAEKSRREFTANVSHELKTPLQSIIGSAELIENDMVQPEDMPRFVGRIRQEAARLVTLIEDIIRLSQLDEGAAPPPERVDLLEVAKEAAANLSQAAAAKNAGVSVSGQNAEIIGVRRLLYEIVYNLCDNAIKYNVDGGSVSITLTQENNSVTLKVTDTGIGIPDEHQSRVFERFYRVDKSRSKSSGGTGLGLSIVKHAVQRLNGSITLFSRVGEGSEFVVTLPANQPSVFDRADNM